MLFVTVPAISVVPALVPFEIFTPILPPLNTTVPALLKLVDILLALSNVCVPPVTAKFTALPIIVLPLRVLLPDIVKEPPLAEIVPPALPLLKPLRPNEPEVKLIVPETLSPPFK